MGFTRRQLGLGLIGGVALAALPGALVIAPAYADDLDGPPNVFISPCGEPFRAKLDQPYPVADWFKQADKNGEFKVASLDAPGMWIVSAAAPSTWKAPEARDGERLGWVQTYYPGVTDPELAARVTTGNDITADIKLAAAPVRPKPRSVSSAWRCRRISSSQSSASD